MFTAQIEIKYFATKSSCLVTSPHHYRTIHNHFVAPLQGKKIPQNEKVGLRNSIWSSFCIYFLR